MATSIGDLFRGRFGGNSSPAPVVHNSGQAQQPQVAPNVKEPVGTQHNPAANPTNPANVPPSGSSNPTSDNTPISHLQPFEKLWDSTATVGADGKPVVDPLSQPLLNTDPAKLAQTARQMDFTNGVDPTLMTKALGGDIEALKQVINGASQNAFIAASTLGQNITENAAKTNNSRLDSAMNERFKQFLVDQQRSDNPVLQHPAVAPVLDLTKQQLTRKHPEKSAGEIQQMAEQYVSGLAEAFTGNKSAAEATRTGSAHDPSDFSNWG